MNTLEGMLGMLADCMRLVWLVPLLPLLAAAAIGMRMLFCRQHGDRHEPLTAGLASGAALGALLLLLLFDLAALLDGVPLSRRCAAANGWRIGADAGCACHLLLDAYSLPAATMVALIAWIALRFLGDLPAP
jgi:hypothetical protein